MSGRLSIALTLAAAATAACALDATQEYRYAGPPKRNARGDIIRRADVLVAFRKIHPCPSTGLATGACPGWALDHVVPLACGGVDAVYNLQWLPDALKSSARTAMHKDAWERQVYANPSVYAGPGCTLRVIGGEP
jgi:hypothetical protein